MKKEIIYEKSTLNRADPQELIEVDSESSFYPNIKQDGKEYCRMYCGKNIHCRPIKSFDPKPFISSTYYGGKDLKLNSLSHEKKIEALLPFGIKAVVEAIEKAYNTSHLHSLQEHHYPFRLRLGGNDDDSWTKYFATEEEMIEEVELLRSKQPINKANDVEWNGYFFTN